MRVYLKITRVAFPLVGMSCFSIQTPRTAYCGTSGCVIVTWSPSVYVTCVPFENG